MNRLMLAVALAAGYRFLCPAPLHMRRPRLTIVQSRGTPTRRCARAPRSLPRRRRPKAAPKPPRPPKPAATKVSSTTTTKTVTQKSYDCSKPGNANKAVCRSAATTPAKPVVKQTTVAHADPNLRLRQARATPTSSSARCRPPQPRRWRNRSRAPKAAAAPKPRAAPKRTAAAAPASVEDHNPSGAIAQCKDGTYSHAKIRTGACSRHGGVAKWS